MPPVDPMFVATLIVIRSSSIQGFLGEWEVLVNDVKHGEIGRGETRRYRFEALPRQNSFKLKTDRAEISEANTFQARRGVVVVFTLSPTWNGKAIVKRVSLDVLQKAAAKKKQRIASAKKAVARKKSRRWQDTSGLSGFLAHWLWPVYQRIPQFWGWDWLVFIALLCLFGRALSLPFRWKSATDEAGMWSLLASNSFTQWLCVWFFQTEAGSALLGNRVWLDAQPLTEPGQGLFWLSCSFCFVVFLVSIGIAVEEGTRETRVTTAHMEAGVLLLAHLFYWHWSVTTLLVFMASLSATLVVDLFQALSVGLWDWQRAR